MGLEPEIVKEQRCARGKWACVYLAENLSGFGSGEGTGELRRAGDEITGMKCVWCFWVHLGR